MLCKCGACGRQQQRQQKATIGSGPTWCLPKTHTDHTARSIKPLAVDLDQAFLGRHTAHTQLRHLGLMQQAARPCAHNTTGQDVLSLACSTDTRTHSPQHTAPLAIDPRTAVHLAAPDAHEPIIPQPAYCRAEVTVHQHAHSCVATSEAHPSWRLSSFEQAMPLPTECNTPTPKQTTAAAEHAHILRTSHRRCLCTLCTLLLCSKHHANDQSQPKVTAKNNHHVFQTQHDTIRPHPPHAAPPSHRCAQQMGTHDSRK
jgi:hypothetical protein